MLDPIIDALACYRITRFIVDDTLVDEARAQVRAWLVSKGRHKLNEGLGCPWCISVYVAVGVVVARKAAPRTWDPIAKALTLSAVAGLISTRVS